MNLVYGGSGSGGASAAGAVTLYESLQSAGFETNPWLKSFYKNASISGMGASGKSVDGRVAGGICNGRNAGIVLPTVNGIDAAKALGKYDDME